MKTIKSLLNSYESFAEGSKGLGVSVVQLRRWSKMGAKFDSNGQVWIKTAKPIEGLKNED
jgi:hypothetical protein